MADEKVGKKRRGSLRTVVSRVFLILGIVLIGAAGALYYNIMHQYEVGERTYDKTRDMDALHVNWKKLRKINPEVVGWIQVPDTVIDYPVAQHDDNEYYLHHTFDLTDSILGCIFLDCNSAADLSDYNTILYGHNMRNGSMFNNIADFTDQDFYNHHKYGYYATPENGTHRLKFIAAIVVEGNEQLHETQFANIAEFRKYTRGLVDRSRISAKGYRISKLKHIYTLCTCSYQFDNARTLLVGIEVDEHGKQI